MEFTKIKYGAEGVELAQKIKGSGGTETRDFTCKTPPLAEYPAALKAFVPYVMELLGLPKEWRDDLTVTTLSIDEEVKTGKLGLVVTALLPVEKANDRPLVLNTPRMREWEDDGNPQPAGTFGDEITALIAEAQIQARRYYKGERGQVEMFESKETTAAPEKTNGTDPAAAPKVRRQRRVKEIEGAGRVMNPEATVPPTDEQIRKQLQISGLDVPAAVIATWTSSEREEALRYANDPDGIATPEHVKKGASLDALTDPKPVRIGSDEKQQIMAAVEAAD
jgi:hypothetical protein